MITSINFPLVALLPIIASFFIRRALFLKCSKKSMERYTLHTLLYFTALIITQFDGDHYYVQRIVLIEFLFAHLKLLTCSALH